MANVEVCVAERSAIYVNDNRITRRSTKWGVRAVLDIFECDQSEVVPQLIARGWTDHLRAIDDEPYATQVARHTGKDG
jgi:hypothetical protein